jgi:predicted membrane GTPase involved in stress response
LVVLSKMSSRKRKMKKMRKRSKLRNRLKFRGRTWTILKKSLFQN